MANMNNGLMMLGDLNTNTNTEEEVEGEGYQEIPGEWEVIDYHGF